MKKFIFVLALFISPLETYAASFTDTLGAECGKILFELESENFYTKSYDKITNRNQQFNALEKCLKIYQDLGGSTSNLNKHYYRANELYIYNLKECSKNKKIEECISEIYIRFAVDLLKNIDELAYFYKDNPDALKIIEVWKEIDKP